MLYLSLLFILIGLCLLIFSYYIVIKNDNYPEEKQEENKYCILIPARDESKVIEDLIISIENQTEKVDSKDVYVIVEDPNDLTISIVKRHNMNIVYRKDLTKQRKGYALDDAIRDILEDNKKYSAYFIFDADNILDKDFIKKMRDSIDKGYDIGIGYRNNKNANSLVSCASAFTFSLINTMLNERNDKYSNTLTISGTGYYIRGSVIEDFGGFPFNTLTEDYELTLYSVLNNLTTTYNDEAIFYDEQPENFNVSLIQRTRWVKGFFEARKKYIKNIWQEIDINDCNFASKINTVIGVNPLICIIIGIILFLIDIFLKYSFKVFIFSLSAFLMIIYCILALITYVMLKKEEDKMNISVSKVKLILYNPLFLASFIICFIKAIFSKNLEWKVIHHGNELVKE